MASHTCLADHTQEHDTLHTEYYRYNYVLNYETYLNPVSKQVMNVNITIIRISIQCHYKYYNCH